MRSLAVAAQQAINNAEKEKALVTAALVARQLQVLLLCCALLRRWQIPLKSKTKHCNAFAPAYYDSIWFVTRTRHSRSNLLNRIFITRGRRTVYSSSAWLIKETVHPLPSHYNKNKHSLRGFLSASGAMLILYQKRERFSPQCH